MLCQYKEIFGKPYEGIHKDRMFGLAFYDVFGTFLLGLFISYYFNVEIYKVFALLTIFVIVIHRLFCVDTALNVALIGKVNSD